MRVLITGHNGYLGSVMVPVLNAAGHTLAGADTFFFEDCTFTVDLARIPAARMDIRHVRVGDLEGFDAVIHLAAVDDQPHGAPSPESIAEINHHSAVRLAGCARAAGVSRFLYASTCSVYGEGTADEALTEDAVVRPATPGATAKARAEDEIVRMADGSFSPVLMRSATAYGVSPRLRADIGLNNLICWAHTTGRVRVTSNAPPWSPLVHVEDIAYAFAAALAAPREAIHGQAFNVGSDAENYQLSELTEIVRAAVPGSTVANVSHDGFPQAGYRVNFGKMARTLPAFRPRWNAAFGAKDLYAALQEAGVTLEDCLSRFTRATRLRHLLDSGRVDQQLCWRPTALAASSGWPA